MEGTRVRRGKSERKARVEPARTRVEERSGGERRRRTRGKIGRSDRGPAETKGVRAICWIVGYRHPEVALIEIMIGGPMVGAARQRGRKGKSELGNERTWPSGSALSRKPSRRSGPIKRPPSLPPLSLSLSFSLFLRRPHRERLHFIISTHFSIWPSTASASRWARSMSDHHRHPLSVVVRSFVPIATFQFSSSLIMKVAHGVEGGTR